MVRRRPRGAAPWGARAGCLSKLALQALGRQLHNHCLKIMGRSQRSGCGWQARLWQSATEGAAAASRPAPTPPPPPAVKPAVCALLMQAAAQRSCNMPSQQIHMHCTRRTGPSQAAPVSHHQPAGPAPAPAPAPAQAGGGAGGEGPDLAGRRQRGAQAAGRGGAAGSALAGAQGVAAQGCVAQPCTTSGRFGLVGARPAVGRRASRMGRLRHPPRQQPHAPAAPTPETTQAQMVWQPPVALHRAAACWQVGWAAAGAATQQSAARATHTSLVRALILTRAAGRCMDLRIECACAGRDSVARNGIWITFHAPTGGAAAASPYKPKTRLKPHFCTPAPQHEGHTGALRPARLPIGSNKRLQRRRAAAALPASRGPAQSGAPRLLPHPALPRTDLAATGAAGTSWPRAAPPARPPARPPASHAAGSPSSPACAGHPHPAGSGPLPPHPAASRPGAVLLLGARRAAAALLGCPRACALPHAPRTCGRITTPPTRMRHLRPPLARRPPPPSCARAAPAAAASCATA